MLETGPEARWKLFDAVFWRLPVATRPENTIQIGLKTNTSKRKKLLKYERARAAAAGPARGPAFGLSTIAGPFTLTV